MNRRNIVNMRNKSISEDHSMPSQRVVAMNEF